MNTPLELLLLLRLLLLLLTLAAQRINERKLSDALEPHHGPWRERQSRLDIGKFVRRDGTKRLSQNPKTSASRTSQRMRSTSAMMAKSFGEKSRTCATFS